MNDLSEALEICLQDVEQGADRVRRKAVVPEVKQSGQLLPRSGL